MASTGHSHACWLSDSQLLLLAALVTSEKGLERGPKGTFLQRLVYSIVVPVLSHADTVVRFNRADVCFDPSFYARITQVQPVSHCLVDIYVSNNVLTNVSLREMVSHWQQLYSALPTSTNPTSLTHQHPCNVFRETCVRSPVDAHCASRWFALRDLLPRMVRLGRARSIYLWLSHWMVFPSLRLSSPERIVSFLIQHFGGTTSSLPALYMGAIKVTLKTLWEQCTHWKPTVINDVSTLTYLYCCCNHAFPKKMTCHKIWKDTLQQIYHCETSSRQSHMSMTTRVPSLGIHLPNWESFMCRIHQQQQLQISTPPPGAAEATAAAAVAAAVTSQSSMYEQYQQGAPSTHCVGDGKKTNAAKRQRCLASVDELGGGGSAAEDHESDPRCFHWEYTEVEMFDIQRHIPPPPPPPSSSGVSSGALEGLLVPDDDEPTSMDVISELLGLSPADFSSEATTSEAMIPNVFGRHASSSSTPMCRLLYEDWTHTWPQQQQNALREAIACKTAPRATDMVYLLVH